MLDVPAEKAIARIVVFATEALRRCCMFPESDSVYFII